MPASDDVVSYEPDNSLRRGFFSLVGDIGRELVDNRWLTYQLFKRDMFAFYKQSLLGAVWIIFVPLITVGTFILLRSSGVVAVGDLSAPYPIYAGLGVAVWQLFAQGILSGASSLVMGGDMIARINFSKKSLVLASLGRTLVTFAVLVLLVVALFVVYAARGYEYSPHLGLLLVPFALLPMILLTLGIGFWLALVNGLVRDVGTVMSVLVTFLLLLTPVLYQRPPLVGGGTARVLSTITEYNPLYYLVSAPRDLVLQGALAEPQGFYVSSAVAVGLFALTLLGFHLTESRIAERI